ncbi:MAG: cyclic nucleotide-binding domain-containing protein [Desulfuromonadales bacterium]|nr:cyclic nucleotide-binding domain-containing protein [Desulfuromonadales bacterium]MDT8423552.1 cyclic nucleotide-binding domain-containing protein [Desulfuromonadales bacterium]
MNPLWSNIFSKKKQEESLAFFLGTVPVFAELSPKELHQLERLMHARDYAPFETVFEQGDPGSGMYVIRSGKVQVFSRNINKEEEELAVLGPGDFFGETTLTAPAARTAFVRTLEQSVLIGLFRADLLEMVQKQADIANKILMMLTRIMSERLLASNTEIIRLKTALENVNHHDE